MIFETQRLILRELTMGDLESLHEILSDPVSMMHYPAPFPREKSIAWIQRNIENYATCGFGLWAVILKDENRFIGECGLTMQKINGDWVPEIGYHINRIYTGKGYATEAAKACRDYAFNVLKFQKVYSYMKYTNSASQKVAIKNGMELITEIPDKVNKITRVYAITLEQYLAL